MSTTSVSNGQLANAMRTSYISQAPFNSDFFQYITTQSPTTFVTTGALSAVTGATSGNCPAGRVLRDNGKRLYPSAHPGVSTYMIGVFDPVSFLRGFIDPNSPVFAVYNSNKPASLDTTALAQGINPNGGAADLAPTVYTRGNIETTNGDLLVDLGEAIVYGDITTTNGDLNVDVGDATVSGDITSTTGNITATAGSVLAGTTLGFTTGAGGTVTQATNKSTTVIINKSTGDITMNSAQLNTGAAVSFTVTNSTCTATDLVIVNIISGGTYYNYRVNAVAGAGAFTVTVYNATGGNLSDALVLKFAVIQAVTA